MQPLELIRAYPDATTLPELLKTRADKLRDKPLLRFGDETISYARFEELTSRLAGAFRQRGVGRGDRVAVVARNHPAHLLVLFAAARIGALMVPINPEFSVGELGYILAHADVSGIVVSPETSASLFEAIPAETRKPFVLTIGAGDKSDDALATAILQDGVDFREETVLPSDPCVIIYTSGTSGKPKGVVHSHRSFILCGQVNIQRLRLQAADVVMIVLPFFHVNALFYSAAGALCAGATIAVFPRFSASGFWSDAASVGATTVNVIETIGNILLARERSEFRPENRIRVIYGVRPRYEAAFREAFAIPQIVSGYGLTEAPGVTCGRLDGPNTPHSIGRLLDHPDPDITWASCRVVDEAGRDVGTGQAGELLVKSPALMLEYFRDPDATREVFRDGWFATGDIVRRDAVGEYFFVSRKKDIIRRRGENISGAELDAVIGSHPGVLEAAAIPVPAELGEDDILAVVVVRPGHDLTPADIKAWCAQRLAPHKVPLLVSFTDALPHTATHKVAKAALRADQDILRRAQAV